MHYRLVSLAASILLLCGTTLGTIGCSNDAKNKTPEVKVDQNAKKKELPAVDLAKKQPAPKPPTAVELAAQEAAAQELVAKEAKEQAAKDLAAKEQAANELTAKELAAKNPPTKDPDPPEPTVIAAKEKEKTKEPAKDPKKEPTKEPKIEFKEPTDAGGKPFKVWKAEIKSPDPTKREAAMKMILNFGPDRCYEAVPDLLGELKKHKAATPIDLAVRVNGLEALTRILASKKDPDSAHLTDAIAVYKTMLKDDQIVVRLTAVRGLVHLGPVARQAIDEVIKLCADPLTYEVRKDAITVLTRLALMSDKGDVDPRVMPILVKTAKFDNSYLVRINAVQGITLVGRDPALRDTALIDLRRPLFTTPDPSFQVRQTALQGLAMLGQEKSLPDLRKSLDDPAKEVRLTAVNMLVALKQYMLLKDEKGAKDEDGTKQRRFTLDKLNAHIITEREPIIRIWARGAIMVLDKIDKGPMNALIKDFQTFNDPKDSTKNSSVRLEALKVISGFEEKAKPYAFTAVLGAIEDEDPTIAVAAMVALVQLQANEAIPYLEKLKDNMKAPQALREAAEEALDAFVILSEQKKAKDKKTPDKK